MAANLFSIAHSVVNCCPTRPPEQHASTPFKPNRCFSRHTFLLLLLLLLLLCPAVQDATHTLKPSLVPIVEGSPFLVVWNAPIARCTTAYRVSLNLDAYTILVNAEEAFKGGNITIFYHNQLGLYPYYVKTTEPPTPIHGGCPQNTSLTEHLDKVQRDISVAIPSDSFAGLSVIDWENWRPLWIRNWGKKHVYRTMSIQLVKQRNPSWSDAHVERQAKLEYETAAVRFMTETLHLARTLRPRGWWGYYLFPDCYNYQYLKDFDNFTGHCPELEVQRNNQLMWLWEHSKALYPSIYMEEVLRSSTQGKVFAWAKLGEALRVAELPSFRHSLPVFVYTRPFYTNTLKEMTKTDLVYTIGQAAAMGAHGIVLWGESAYSRNRENCLMIKEYLTSTLGPYIVNVTLAAKLCSRLVCNNHGRCIRRRMDSDTYLHLNSSSFNIRVNSNDSHTQVSVTGALSSQQKDKMRQEFTCHCYQGWQGERCHIRENTRGQGLTLQTWDWCLPVAVLTAVLEWH